VGCASKLSNQGRLGDGKFAFSLYDAFTIFLSLIEKLDSEAVHWLDMTMHIFWNLDIIFSFWTGVYIDFQLELGLGRIARQYLRTWFLVDVFVVLPQWGIYIFWGRENSPYAQHSTSLKLLKSVRTVRLMRLAKVMTLVKHALERCNNYYIQTVLHILGLMGGVASWVHVTGCGWWAIGAAQEGGWVHVQDLLYVPFTYKYAISMCWSVTQLQGNYELDLKAASFEELSYLVGAVLGSIVVLGLFLSSLTRVIMETSQHRKIKARQMEQTCAYMHSNSISMELNVKVKQHIRQCQQLASDSIEDEATVLSGLPVTMRRKLLQEARGPKVAKHAVFYSMRDLHPRPFERICCDLLIPQSYFTDVILFSYGEACNKMMFVLAGGLSYFRYSSVLMSLMQRDGACGNPRDSTQAIQRDLVRSINRDTCNTARLLKIRPGDALCEPVLWCRWQHCGDLTTCHVTSSLELSYTDFASLVTMYPRLKPWAEDYAVKFVDALNDSTKDVSDLFDTNAVFNRDAPSFSEYDSFTALSLKPKRFKNLF